MSSQLLGFGVTDVDKGAAAQQLALIQATYAEDLSPIAPMLLPDGQVVAHDFDSSTWPPSYLIIRAAENDYVLALGGTTSAQSQAGWHVWGTFSYSTVNGSVVNGQWERVYGPILAQCLSLGSSTGAPLRWRISGHSYGGAVAELLAGAILRERPAWSVSVMTFGAPRARGEGYGGPSPSPFWEVQSTGDGVPQLPPAGLYPYGAIPVQLIGLVFRHVDWRHYGYARWLWPDGSIGNSGSTPDPLPPGVSTGIVGSHLVGNYAARLAANYAREGGSAQMAQALGILGFQVAQPPAQAPGGLPMTIPSLEGAIVPNPYPFAPDGIPLFAESRIMANPEYLVGGTAFHTAILFNSGSDAGWSENYWLYSSSAEATLDSIKPAILALVTERKKLLTSASSVFAVRVSKDNPKGKSRTFKGASVGSGPGTGGAVRVDSGNLFLLDVIDVGEAYKAKLSVRGLAVGNAQIAAGNDRTTEPPSAGVVAFLNVMRNALIGQNGILPFGVRGAIKVREKRESVQIPSPIVKYGLENCRLYVEVAGGISGVVQGDWVVLSHKKQECITGLTGEARVISITTATTPGAQRYNLDKGYCCDEASLAKAIGTVRKRLYAYVAVGSIEYDSLSYRKAGRPFGLRRGRQSTRCC